VVATWSTLACSARNLRLAFRIHFHYFFCKQDQHAYSYFESVSRSTRRICSIQSVMMSSDSIARSTAAGSHIATGTSEVKQQSKEIPPPLGYTTPPHTVLISKHHSSTNMGSFRLKKHRCNSYDSAIYHPVVRSSSTGRRLLLNVDSFETGVSFPTILDLRDTPKNEFILATPNQVITEIQHLAIEKPAIAMSRRFSTADLQVNSNDEIISENSRHVSLPCMFLPGHEDTLEEDNTVMPRRFGLRLKPKKQSVCHMLFK
jgi:hypothetical protein